jgi:large subunit ribosomal protein L22
MVMKGYSNMPESTENCARARLEGVNASYKDLAEVCGRIRNKKTDWAVSFLEKAAEGEVPILFKRHNKNLGHRHELGGQKGRYPWKAAKIVLKTLQSAMSNGKTLGLGEVYKIVAASANKKDIFPRMAPKGRTARSYLVTSRVEIILKGLDAPKGVSVTPPKKKGEAAGAGPKKADANPETPAVGDAGKKEPPKLLKDEGKVLAEHKHEAEKAFDKAKPKADAPHQHGENNKR